MGYIFDLALYATQTLLLRTAARYAPACRMRSKGQRRQRSLDDSCLRSIHGPHTIHPRSPWLSPYAHVLFPLSCKPKIPDTSDARHVTRRRVRPGPIAAGLGAGGAGRAGSVRNSRAAWQRDRPDRSTRIREAASERARATAGPVERRLWVSRRLLPPAASTTLRVPLS